VIVLDLPPPVSVNKSRKIDWANHHKVKGWLRMADQFLLIAKSRHEVSFDRIPRYELLVTLSEDHCKVDADNGLKLAVDYLRMREITLNDSPKNLRKLTVQWGFAPAGMQITVTPLPEIDD
jgi:hypothetical protein